MADSDGIVLRITCTDLLGSRGNWLSLGRTASATTRVGRRAHRGNSSLILFVWVAIQYIGKVNIKHGKGLRNPEQIEKVRPREIILGTGWGIGHGYGVLVMVLK